jgi:hypothetical protein
MRSNNTPLIFLALVAFTASGCGTLCNFGASVFHIDGDELERPAVYGGVEIDCAGLAAITKNGGLVRSGGTGGIATICWAAAEFAASFVADTLTLPITVLIHEYRVAHRTPEIVHVSQDVQAK